MPKASSFIVKTTQSNGITEQFARLIGYEPYRDGMFEQRGDNGVKGLYRPLIDVDGYDGVCPIEFNPYKDGNDAMQVAAYLRAHIQISQDGKGLRVTTDEFEAISELPTDKAYLHRHTQIMRDTIMAVAAMYAKKYYDIDPPVNTWTRTETVAPATAPHVKTFHKNLPEGQLK